MTMTSIFTILGFLLGPYLVEEIFHRLTQAVRRMMSRRGFPDLVVYLDDFLVIGSNEVECSHAYNTLTALLTDLGFELSEHKLVAPTQQLSPDRYHQMHANIK